MNIQDFDLTSQAFKRDPMPTFAAMRDAGPFVYAKLPIIGKVWLATTYESANTVLRDPKNFARDTRFATGKYILAIQRLMPRSFRVLSKNMLATDEPGHRRLRSLVEQAFLRQSVEDMRGRIESLADNYLDQTEQIAKQNGGEVDLVQHFARPFPLAVICELLGLPEADRPMFTRSAKRLMNVKSAWQLPFALSGVWKLFRYFKEQFRERRQHPRPGLLSALVEAEQDGHRLTEDELLSMAYLLLLAGHETTVYLISTGVFALLEHEDQRRTLAADWSLAPSAVDESLRFMSPIQFTKPRFIRQDLELFGQSLPRGEMVIALIGSANCDPAHFNEPERFDIRRRANSHLGFGAGIHTCLGLKLARAEASIAFEKLFTRYPNLDLACVSSDLEWSGRIGTRALNALPIQLNTQG